MLMLTINICNILYHRLNNLENLEKKILLFPTILIKIFFNYTSVSYNTT